MAGGVYPTGLPNTSVSAHVMARYNDSLAVADGYERFLLWDGQGWTRGPNFPSLMNYGNYVAAMLQVGGDLYAGGLFGDTPPYSMNPAFLMRFDGAAWVTLPDDLNNSPF